MSMKEILRTWRFQHCDSDGDMVETSFHPSEEGAQRAACLYIIDSLLDNWDFEETKEEIGQFLEQVRVGSFGEAVVCFLGFPDQGEQVTVEGFEVTPGADVPVMEAYVKFLKRFDAAIADEEG